MMIKRFFLFSLIFIGLASFSEAQQFACTEGVEFYARIKAQYGEDPVFQGITTGGGLVKLLTNFDTGTWSLTVEFSKDSKTYVCIMSSGDGGTILPPPLPGRPL